MGFSCRDFPGTGVTFGQTLKKGMVVAVSSYELILEDNVTFDQFIKFLKEKDIPPMKSFWYEGLPSNGYVVKTNSDTVNVDFFQHIYKQFTVPEFVFTTITYQKVHLQTW